MANLPAGIGYAKKLYHTDDIDEKKAAYALLAIIYGLSFFRVTNFMLPGENDNREIAFDLINRFFRVDLP